MCTNIVKNERMFLPDLSSLCITDVQIPPQTDFGANDAVVAMALQLYVDISRRLAEFEEFKPFSNIIRDVGALDGVIDASRKSIRIVAALDTLASVLETWTNYFQPKREYFKQESLVASLKEVDTSIREVDIDGSSVQFYGAWNAATLASDFSVLDPILRSSRPSPKDIPSEKSTVVSGSSSMHDGEEIEKKRKDAGLMPPPRKMTEWAQAHFMYKRFFDRLMAQYKEAKLHSKRELARQKVGRTFYAPSTPNVDPLMDRA